MTRRLPLPLLLAATATMLVAAPLHAQLTVDVSDGWTLTFAGNVNTFLVYESEADDGEVGHPAALVGTGRSGIAIRTGLLPAFAVFDVRGHEGGLDLGAHFGFAPEVQTPGGHDNDSSGTQAGTRIDMRQVYLSLGGRWGQLLAGREIGLFLRQNMLTDQSLFGVGATGGNFGNPASTTLGRIGYGYAYPGFNAQLTYSTPAGRPVQLSLGLFDPSTNDDFDELTAPRVEAELVYRRPGTTLWSGGLVQRERDRSLDAAATAWGVSLGGRAERGALSLTASGFYGRGIGATYLFSQGRSTASGSTALRPGWGFLGQLGWNPGRGPLTLVASYGQGRLTSADDEPDFRVTNSSITAGAYYQVTRSLKAVTEATRARSQDADPATRANRSTAVAAGLMLFF